MNQPPGRPAEVLLVEDNEADVRLVREALRDGSREIRLHLARDGEEALVLLRMVSANAPAMRPDLIVLDLNLPRKDGRELLTEIKSDPILRRIPVVVLTTSSIDRDVQHAYDLLANCYVVKPVGLDRFLETVRGIAHFWLGMARLPDAG